jgi:hypothetical protein
METTEITPEPFVRKPERYSVRLMECCGCERPIGNRDFETFGTGVICLDCYRETGDSGG